MKAKKSLGQNFLMHAQIANRIVHTAQVSREDVVVEVGPGTGMLTKELLATGATVVAIEADRDLIPVLSETFRDALLSKQLTLIEGDVRTTPLLPYVQAGAYKVVANIPYYITGEIIRLFLSHPLPPKSMTLLVQKEVAIRVAREKKESLLSLSVKTYGTPTYAFTVSRGAFVPKPKVDSAVLHIEHVKNPFGSSDEAERFFAMLHAGFAHKRKFVLNNLSSVAGSDALTQAFSELHLSPKSRAEDFTLSTWRALFEVLRKH